MALAGVDVTAFIICKRGLVSDLVHNQLSKLLGGQSLRLARSWEAHVTESGLKEGYFEQRLNILDII